MGRARRGSGQVIEQRTRAGETRFLARWYEPQDPAEPDGPRVRRSRGGFHTRADAEAHLAEVRLAIRAGRSTGAGSALTVEGLLKRYIENANVADSTRAGYRRLARLHINPHIGARRVAAVRPSTLAGLYRTLQAGGLGANTTRKVHHLLSGAFDSAVADGIIGANPTRSKSAAPPTVADVRQEAPRVNVWTASQLVSFLDWAKDCSPDFVAWELAAGTGMRRGELVGLRWGDVDLATGLVTVRRAVAQVKEKGEHYRLVTKLPKGKKVRTIGLPPRALEVLREEHGRLERLGANRVAPDAPVLQDATGEAPTPDSLGNRWEWAVRAYRRTHPNVATITLHGVRHSHATILLQEGGASIRTVQERLGHASVTTTERYTHVGDAGQAVAALGGLGWGTPPGTPQIGA